MLIAELFLEAVIVLRITRNNDFIATASKVEISPDYDRFKIIGNAVSKVYSDKEIK